MSALVREAHARGHEIASHGWIHERVETHGREGFREDVRRSLGELGDLIGAPLRGFRAPIFSITGETMWALEVLAELGLAHDSSIFPIAGRRYGIAGFPRHAVRLSRGGASIVEVPLSAVDLLGRSLPVAGGGYFRLMPPRIIQAAFTAVHRDGRPFVAYMHPYEFDPEPLRHRGDEHPSRSAARREELLTNLARRTMPAKLSRLLSEFRFSSIDRCLRHAE